MTFRVEDLRHILGSRLAHLWLSDQARGRAITCVTWIESATDTADAQTGELMIVPPGLVPGSQVLSILEQASPSPAVLLLKTVGLSDAEIRRIHALAAGGRWASPS